MKKYKIINYAIIYTIIISQFNICHKIKQNSQIYKELEITNNAMINEIDDKIKLLNSRVDNLLLETKKIKTVQSEKNTEINKYIEKNAIVSYYTHLPDEGGGLGITASGNKVSNTSVAIPRKDDLLNFGDTIIFEDLSPKYMADYDGQHLTRVADDTGNPKYIRKVDDNTYRLDVYCPKLPNETNLEYKKRVLSYGKTETKIKIKNKE